MQSSPQDMYMRQWRKAARYSMYVVVLFFRAEMAAVPWSVHKGERDSKAEYADDEIKHCALGIVGPKR